MTYWVHGGENGLPRPAAIPGVGFARYHVRTAQFDFEFASLSELRACIDTLGLRVLPTTVNESARHGGGNGPNTHWLSRLPARLLPWQRRQRIVRDLSHALARWDTAPGAADKG